MTPEHRPITINGTFFFVVHYCCPVLFKCKVLLPHGVSVLPLDRSRESTLIGRFRELGLASLHVKAEFFSPLQTASKPRRATRTGLAFRGRALTLSLSHSLSHSHLRSRNRRGFMVAFLAP